MTFRDLSLLIHYSFESKNAISHFSDTELKYFRDCIKKELKRRNKWEVEFYEF